MFYLPSFRVTDDVSDSQRRCLNFRELLERKTPSEKGEYFLFESILSISTALSNYIKVLCSI